MQKDNRKLLQEGYPSYMVFSIDEMENIFESFANIFKSVWSSIKLLSNTLLLNLKLITYNVTLDKQKIAQAKADFSASRDTYNAETEKNLKYFRKYYSESRTDTLWGTGPGMLAFLANPFAFIATSHASEKDSPTNFPTPPAPKDSTSAKQRSVISDKVKRAMIAFGFSVSEQRQPAGESLTEQVQSKQQPNKAVTLEANKLQDLAKRYIATETEHAKILSSQISDRAAVIKKIVDASTFDEMISAAAAGEKIKMGLSSSAFKAASTKINEDLVRQNKEDPKTFKKAIADMREKAPEITEKDDVKAMSQFLFGVSKSRIQKQVAASYKGFLDEAKSAMNLPIDPQVVKQLEKDSIGKQYLMMLQSFERSLEMGQQEMQKFSKEKI
jgi:hypothetical protein